MIISRVKRLKDTQRLYEGQYQNAKHKRQDCSTYAPSSTNDDQLRFLRKLPVFFVFLIIHEHTSYRQVLRPTCLGVQSERIHRYAFDVSVCVGEGVVQEDCASQKEHTRHTRGGRIRCPGHYSHCTLQRRTLRLLELEILGSLGHALLLPFSSRAPCASCTKTVLRVEWIGPVEDRVLQRVCPKRAFSSQCQTRLAGRQLPESKAPEHCLEVV